MNRFPETINIFVIDENTRKPISKIATKIKLFASRKNDYHFILPLSDEKGCIEVTRDWLKQEILKEQALFVMDYSSMLDDCKPQVEISVLGDEDLSRAVNAMYLFQSTIGISADEIDNYKNANNSMYYPCLKHLEFEGVKSLDVNIPLKKSAM